eukprot:TRINITY_DN35486_c0_g1_i1.p1 TRINITY_DN35486_c0_g1~~TRINITY_DN35486_c0_g1_i1.p1  ORF type:complete len:160 (+),score=24.66 TRINITY_DN35486_c0_g1_i1:1283-1762(+)
MDEYTTYSKWDFHYLRWNQKFHKTSDNWLYFLVKNKLPEKPIAKELLVEEKLPTTEPVPNAPINLSNLLLTELKLKHQEETELPAPKFKLLENAVCMNCENEGSTECIENWDDIQQWAALNSIFPMESQEPWDNEWLEKMDKDSWYLRTCPEDVAGPSN